MINYTTPFLPPKSQFQKYIDSIWSRKWLTNNGPLVNEFEAKIRKYLNNDNFLLVNNGTSALQLAIKALSLSGKIITTPFSFIATTSSLLWENCEPVYVDIDKESFNIDPQKIEQVITERTTGILATHVYGNPCDIEAIMLIAQRHNLKVIFDAAHCFGTKYRNKSVLEFGDVSTISFHATKLLHTIEGGGVVARDEDVFKKVSFMRNFGFNGPEDFAEVGINAKASEFNAAMGLANLDYISLILEHRRSVSIFYDEQLLKTGLKRPSINEDVQYNYAYYAVLFDSEEKLLTTIHNLNAQNIYPRRYFYPLLSNFFERKRWDLPVSEFVSKRILCLPVSEYLSKDDQLQICRIIKESI